MAKPVATAFDDLPATLHEWFPDALAVVTVRRDDGVVELVPVLPDDSAEVGEWLDDRYPGGLAQLEAEDAADGPDEDLDAAAILAAVRAR